MLNQCTSFGWSLPFTLADSDFVDNTPVQWVFTAGSQAGDTHCVEIVIIDDRCVEEDEYFSVNMTTSDEDVKFHINYASIRILDDDSEYDNLKDWYYVSVIVRRFDSLAAESMAMWMEMHFYHWYRARIYKSVFLPLIK